MTREYQPWLDCRFYQSANPLRPALSAHCCSKISKLFSSPSWFHKNARMFSCLHELATLVDGILGHANHDDTVDMVYLPISMGFWSCYKWYMISLGFKARCAPDGGVIVNGIDNGKPIYHCYVSYSAYYSKWKRDYPQLKVSRPAEDICQYCITSGEVSVQVKVKIRLSDNYEL